MNMFVASLQVITSAAVLTYFNFRILFRSSERAVRRHQAPDMQTHAMSILACVISSRLPSINIVHGRFIRARLFMPRQR